MKGLWYRRDRYWASLPRFGFFSPQRRGNVGWLFFVGEEECSGGV